MSKPSNPPLFVIHHDDAGGGIEINITLRDLFAAFAMGQYQRRSFGVEQVARFSYEQADAMLREREKP